MKILYDIIFTDFEGILHTDQFFIRAHSKEEAEKLALNHIKTAVTKVTATEIS